MLGLEVWRDSADGFRLLGLVIAPTAVEKLQEEYFYMPTEAATVRPFWITLHANSGHSFRKKAGVDTILL